MHIVSGWSLTVFNYLPRLPNHEVIDQQPRERTKNENDQVSQRLGKQPYQKKRNSRESEQQPDAHKIGEQERQNTFERL